MLTGRELTWLKRRKLYAGVNLWSRFSCQWCEHLDVDREGYRTPCGASIYGCPRVDMDGDNDDVEFEAQVAAKLAECMDYRVPCASTDECNTPKLSCAECRLKIARLAVEEEMDANTE